MIQIQLLLFPHKDNMIPTVIYLSKVKRVTKLKTWNFKRTCVLYKDNKILHG
ncbi:hypothetical protein Hanom_Chr13g01209631 [Helianthus anomalus]